MEITQIIVSFVFVLILTVVLFMGKYLTAVSIALMEVSVIMSYPKIFIGISIEVIKLIMLMLTVITLALTFYDLIKRDTEEKNKDRLMIWKRSFFALVIISFILGLISVEDGDIFKINFNTFTLIGFSIVLADVSVQKEWGKK